MDPVFYRQPWDEEDRFLQHRIDTGNEVTYTVLGSAQKLGAHQPRCDVGFWTVNRDELMDPVKRAQPLPQRRTTVTVTLIVCASRSSVVVTVSPGARVLRKSEKAPRPATVSPFISSNTSPAFIPANSAGESGTTESTRTPSALWAKSGTVPKDTRRCPSVLAGRLSEPSEPAAAVLPERTMGSSR